MDAVAKSMASLPPTIPLTNAKGVFSAILAEYCIASMLYFTKQLSRLERNRKNKVWDKFVMGTLAGKTIGFVGYGHIAQCIAKACVPFNMRVFAFRKRMLTYSSDIVSPVKVWTSGADISEFLEECDFVVSTLPATDASYHFCDSRFFSYMKPTSVFISLGRGSCVDEDALCTALNGGQIAGVALDVFEEEPLPESSPLWECENCLISSHNADWSGNNLHDSMKVFMSNLQKFVNRQPLDNLVDRELGY